MADNDYIPPGMGQPPGLLRSVLGGAVAGMAGTISPQQAYSMGFPQAAGMTMQQLQVLAQAPERQAQLAATQQATQQSAQMFPAQLADIQAQVKQREAMANRPAGGNNAMDDESKRTIAMDLANGKLTAVDLPAVLGRGSPKDRADIYRMAKALNPKLSLRQQDIDVVRQRSAARGAGSELGRTTQDVSATVTSIEGTLDKIKETLPNVPSAKLKTITGALRAGENELNDPDITEFYGYMTALRGYYASLLRNGKTPDLRSEDEAGKVISNYVDKNGFKGLDKFMRTEGKIRLKGVTQGVGIQQNQQTKQGKSVQIGRFQVQVQ